MPNYNPPQSNLKRRYKTKDNYTLSKRNTTVKLPVEYDDVVWSIDSTSRSAWLRRLVANGINVRQDNHPIQQAITILSRTINPTVENPDLDMAIAKLKQYQSLVELPPVEEKEIPA